MEPPPDHKDAHDLPRRVARLALAHAQGRERPPPEQLPFFLRAVLEIVEARHVLLRRHARRPSGRLVAVRPTLAFARADGGVRPVALGDPLLADVPDDWEDRLLVELSDNDDVAAFRLGDGTAAGARRGDSIALLHVAGDDPSVDLLAIVAACLATLGGPRDRGGDAGAVSFNEGQRRTLALLLAGRTEGEIAAETGDSPNTVHSRVRRIYSAYHVSNQPQLMAKLLPPPTAL